MGFNSGFKGLSQLYRYRHYGTTYVDVCMWWVINVWLRSGKSSLVFRTVRSEQAGDAFALDFICKFVIRNSYCLVIFSVCQGFFFFTKF